MHTCEMFPSPFTLWEQFVLSTSILLKLVVNVFVLVSDPQDDRQRGADFPHEASQRRPEADARLSAAKVTSAF